jgi:hypothetical protein
MAQAGAMLLLRVTSLDLFFNLPNPSSRAIFLRSTQSVTQMSARNLPWIKGCPARKDDNLTSICELNLHITQPYGPPRSVTLSQG